ncbi:cation diffusion facilitator family transporter [Paenibacillus alginolyticus]|uniref:Cation diffusion facilitator family transporter n=1 Tax=Paenibacillus alginolyticus TaxID=59839 RepID=A0ABT4GIW5_9BACL|nr:cation diffusion facilitator family transporter [Paenibacillus alginolyticus]MCY9696149.1 cation diffusion facilitator family transporter [Paenibacillus alginolyticus]MEC0143302.1 cation diffusion facilitator family transporter [Paenibacillus alginolyticus]
MAADNHSHEGHSHEHHNHSHSHGHGHNHSHAPNNKKGLTIALIITGGIMFLEFFGGLITNSLALLSDSGHMLSDAASLALSLVAMWFATRPASPGKSFGYYRFEILAALFNGLTLFIVAAFIIKEAYARFFDPPTVSSGSMILIAFVGLLANLLSVWALMKQSDVKENINVRSAYMHVIGDALGSVGAIIAGLLMLFFDWYIADPIISVIVALLILKGAWGVIRNAVHILMEGTPITIDMNGVKKTLESINGVINVHDLHVWTITSGLDSLSCHIVIENAKDSQDILQKAIHEIENKFKILHTTFQIEMSNVQHAEFKV